MTDSITFNLEMTFTYGEARQLSPLVRRVVARNPGKLTFKGTNSYIVGKGQVAIIDPGPDDPEHLAALLAATRGETVTHILITHTHKDHSPLAAALKAETGAVTYAFPPITERRGDATASPTGSPFVDRDFVPDHCLKDGQIVTGTGWTLEAIHTPGHAPDHLCFALKEENTLFSGDHVMGWNTSVIAPPEGNLGDYLDSLEKLLARNDRIYWPAHGGRITAPQRWVKAYLMHRKMRENQILDCLREGPMAIETIVSRLYPNLAPELIPAATLSVRAHLAHLVEKGVVGPMTPQSSSSPYHLLSQG